MNHILSVLQCNQYDYPEYEYCFKISSRPSVCLWVQHHSYNCLIKTVFNQMLFATFELFYIYAVTPFHLNSFCLLPALLFQYQISKLIIDNLIWVLTYNNIMYLMMINTTLYILIIYLIIYSYYNPLTKLLAIWLAEFLVCLTETVYF